MSNIRFLHAADFHLDSAFGALTPEQAKLRRQEQRDLVDELCQYINDHQISLVLLAGDLLENNEPYAQTVPGLIKALGSVKAEVCIAPGNHDFCAGNSPYRTMKWPKNVHIFTENTMKTLEFPLWNLTVSGAGFTAPQQPTSMLTGHTMPKDGRVHLGLFHGDLQPNSPYHPISKEDIESSGFQYLALGHTHKRCLPTAVGGTLVAWPGCLEGRGFDEQGEKGFYAGTVSQEGQISVAFVPFAKRMHKVLRLDVTGQDPLGAISQALSIDGKNHLYRIVLTGQADKVDVAGLQATLSPGVFHLELQDETKVMEDVWARKDEDSLRGLFLRHMEAALTQTPEDGTILQATQYGLAALDGTDF